jgi:SAM-dependent methyltransferase
MVTRFFRKLGLILRRGRAKRFVRERLTPAVDWARMTELKDRFKDPAQFPDYHRPAGHYKYFTYDQYLVRNAERLLRLGLEHGPPKKVLDLGCGFGYFLLCCKVSGHSVTGLDLSVEMYDRVLEVLAIPKFVHRIEPFEALPLIPGGPFDLVTAYEINFDIVGDGGWTVPQWDWFLRDLARQMTDDAQLMLKFNDKHGVPILQGPVLDYFIRLGAEIDGRLAHLPSLKAKMAATPVQE